MNNVAHFTSRRQEPLMPMTPQQRVQEAVNGELVPLIAELVYQSDKKSRRAKLSDLRSEEARAVYLAEALMCLAPDARHERIVQVQQADAEHLAHQSDEHESIAFQVLGDQDVDLVGPQCRSTDARRRRRRAWTAGRRAHGSCCAKDARHFVFVAFTTTNPQYCPLCKQAVNEFTYQLEVK